ncbi:MAG: hypothetical protein ACHP65_06085 [Legionellales bacterium]
MNQEKPDIAQNDSVNIDANNSNMSRGTAFFSQDPSGSSTKSTVYKAIENCIAFSNLHSESTVADVNEFNTLRQEAGAIISALYQLKNESPPDDVSRLKQYLTHKIEYGYLSLLIPYKVLFLGAEDDGSSLYYDAHNTHFGVLGTAQDYHVEALGAQQGLVQSQAAASASCAP